MSATLSASSQHHEKSARENRRENSNGRFLAALGIAATLSVPLAASAYAEPEPAPPSPVHGRPGDSESDTGATVRVDRVSDVGAVQLGDAVAAAGHTGNAVPRLTYEVDYRRFGRGDVSWPARAALAMARILGNPIATNQWPAAAKALASLLDKLHSVSARRRRGSLAVVRTTTEKSGVDVARVTRVNAYNTY